MESSEKEKNLIKFQARVPKDLLGRFWQTVRTGSKKQHVAAAAMRLWTSLPGDIRKVLTDAEESEGEDYSFKEIVEEIVVKKVREILTAQAVAKAGAQAQSESQRQPKHRTGAKAG